MGRGMKAIRLWYCWGVMKAQDCVDSSLKLICVVGSGGSHLLFDHTTQILWRVEVRPLGWSVKPSNTMVSTPVIGSFGSVGRCQVLLAKGNDHLLKAYQPTEAWSALKYLNWWQWWSMQWWHWTSENTVDQHQQYNSMVVLHHCVLSEFWVKEAIYPAILEHLVPP